MRTMVEDGEEVARRRRAAARSDLLGVGGERHSDSIEERREGRR